MAHSSQGCKEGVGREGVQMQAAGSWVADWGHVVTKPKMTGEDHIDLPENDESSDGKKKWPVERSFRSPRE